MKRNRNWLFSLGLFALMLLALATYSSAAPPSTRVIPDTQGAIRIPEPPYWTRLENCNYWFGAAAKRQCEKRNKERLAGKRAPEDPLQRSSY